MNRAQLQALAAERVLDARALLDGARWWFAYYNAGYAVECALKAAFLARMPLTGWAFREKARIEECRTHDFNKLLDLADLRVERVRHEAANLAAGGLFKINWSIIEKWRVESRYSTTTTEQEARDLFAAITDRPDGALPWIMMYW